MLKAIRTFLLLMVVLVCSGQADADIWSGSAGNSTFPSTTVWTYSQLIDSMTVDGPPLDVSACQQPIGLRFFASTISQNRQWEGIFYGCDSLTSTITSSTCKQLQNGGTLNTGPHFANASPQRDFTTEKKFILFHTTKAVDLGEEPTAEIFCTKLTTPTVGTGTDDQTSYEVVFTPNGLITENNVQGAVQGLETRKAAKSDTANYATGANSPIGVDGCTLAGDLYRQSGTTPDLMWTCQTAGAPGTWSPIANSPLGEFLISGTVTSGQCAKQYFASTSVATTACSSTNTDPMVARWNQTDSVALKLKITNRVALATTDGCKFTLQRVSNVGGTVDNIAVVTIPATPSGASAAGAIVNTVLTTNNALAEDTFLRVLVENSASTYCPNGGSCVCVGTSIWQIAVTGAR